MVKHPKSDLLHAAFWHTKSAKHQKNQGGSQWLHNMGTSLLVVGNGLRVLKK